jgi:hypothetical protein
MTDRIDKIEQFVNEKRVKEEGNGFIALIVAVLLIIITFVLVYGFRLNTRQIIIFVLLIIAFYIVVLSFLFEHKLIREIINTITRTVEKNIEKETIKNVDRPIFYEIEKPIIHDVIRTVDRPIIIKREKLNIPKYDYIGSSQTMTYHKKSCRLGKLIKRKYAINDSDSKYFIKNRYKPCKVCILKQKKI